MGVRTFLVRITPRQPLLRVRRSIVQRATGTPSRCRCAHILQAPVQRLGWPVALNIGFVEAASHSVIVVSNNARLDGGRVTCAQ